MKSFQIRNLLSVFLVMLTITAATAQELISFPAQVPGVPFPTEKWPEFPVSDAPRLQVDSVVRQTLDGTAVASLAKTKAFLVVWRGQIAGEWYQKGVSQSTRLQSWSVAKGMLHAALGIALGDHTISIQSGLNIADWSGSGDPRARITVRQLAQMTDGLRFDENYGDPQSHVMQMLFGAGRADTGEYAARSGFSHDAGTHWSYSGGSANILSRFLRDRLGGGAKYSQFLRDRLFGKIGMTSAVPEFDASGTWIGSSYVHATARDFAKFGLLYLRGGNWNGEQLIPESWVDIARMPTLASKGQYGALFWLNAINPDTGLPAISTKLPEDLFLARGFGGQIIAVVPSRDAVVVMLNANYGDEVEPIIDLVAKVLEALR